MNRQEGPKALLSASGRTVAPLDSKSPALGQQSASNRQPGDDDGDETDYHSRLGVSTVRSALGGVFQRASTTRAHLGMPCGIEQIDLLLGGFRPQRICVLGASTSWGKSSFAVMAIDEGLRKGARILLVTGEDAEDMYGQRLMCRRAGVNAIRLRNSACTPQEFTAMASAVEAAEEVPFFLNGIGKPVEWCAKAIKALVAEEPYDLVIVDYIQAFSCAKKTQDRRNEVTFIFRTFADAIKQSGAAGLILSQLRRLEDNEVPNIHDLKESGDVENGAEHVLLGYRVTPKGPANAPPSEPKRYVIVGKNKDGPTVSEPIEMSFDALTASFRTQKMDLGYEQRSRYDDLYS